MRIKSVCIFCGARDTISPEYMELAKKCGQTIASKGLELIYGGGKTGMMGAVSQATSAGGGKVTGIYPKFLNDMEPLKSDLDNTIFVKDMFERKKHFIEVSDAFIILPGGFGTIDEIFEVITLKIFKQHNKPIIICNYNNFWKDLLKCCNKIIGEGFARNHANDAYIVVKSLEEAFQKLKV